MSDKRSYRVLHIFSAYGGGISSLISNLIENKTQDFRFDIMAFSYKNGDAFVERIRKMGGEVYQMPRPRIDGYGRFKSYIDEVLAQNQYDAVHCHITGWHAKPFMDLAKKHGIGSFVLHAHTTRYDSRIDRIPGVQAYDRYLDYKRSVAFLTCSDIAAEYIYGKGYLKKRPAHLIPNGVDEDRFAERAGEERRLAYQKEFRVPDGAIVIGHVGRFSYPKNHPFMIDIAKELKDRGVSFVLILVGSGEKLDAVKEKAAKEDLLEQIRFAGRRTDVSTLMRYFDCMMLPSYYEGLPTVAVECQAAGTRMLLSDPITKQCDMDLGALEFLPLGEAAVWADALVRISKCGHLDDQECLKRIRSLGFTSKEAGKRYCDLMKDIIRKDA